MIKDILCGIKGKMAGKVIEISLIGMAGAIGVSPMTAFAKGDEVTCVCETKCSEKAMNEECEVCSYDRQYCEGKEQEPEEVIPEEEYGPLTPDGNLTLVDDYGTLDVGGKQFITVVTKSGKYFYKETYNSYC